MSEELLQRDLIENPEKIGIWNFYNIGSTTINSLKKSGIIRNMDYGSLGGKKVDGLITNKKIVIAVIEYKPPRNFNTQQKKTNAIQQEYEVAKRLGAKLYVATDTKESVWINVLTGNIIKDEKNNNFSYLFNPKNPDLYNIIEKIIQSISNKNDRIIPKNLIDPTDLAKSIWQDIWSVSGATPENCLYTFVELFIFKYLSDLGILTGTYSFDNLISMFSGNDESVVLEHYANSIRPHIKKLFPENNIDKTTIINGTIFVSKDQNAVIGYSSVFKKILNRFKNYGKLENIDYDFKSKLFESFLKESISKKNWGQFFTPIKVVKAINTMCQDLIKEGVSICDPACGVGKFLLEAIKEDIPKYYIFNNDAIQEKITIAGFDKGFDKDEQKTIILAKANMLIYFSELISKNITNTIKISELFNKSFVLKTNSILGTLAETNEEKYDLILTNPPYVTSGSSNLKEEISKNTELKNFYKINAMGVEGLFVEWIVKALKRNGKAFVILPMGIFHNFNHSKLREYLLDTCYIDAIISLPKKTFFNTTKKTYILVITKKKDISLEQKEPVFTYYVSEIGESRDVNRFNIEDDDLNEAVALYNLFKGNKKYFKNIYDDKRCKILDFNFFKDNTKKSWLIDDLWTTEEKIEIGIINQDISTNLLDCSLSLEDIAISIKSLNEEIQEIFSKSQDVKKIHLLDEKYFSLIRGKRITKQTINQNNGNIPVYSSSKDQSHILGHVSESYLQQNKLILMDTPSILMNIDGSVGHCFIRNDKKYSYIDVVAGLQAKHNNIDLEYLLYALRNAILATGADYDRKLYFNKIENYNIEIPIPVNEQGNFDLEKQIALRNIYKQIEDIKKDAKKELEKLSVATIEY